MPRRLLYWTFTTLLVAWLLLGGTLDLMRAPAVVAILQTLHYPLYLSSILGTAKLLGVAALLYPGARLLREWAYAGIAFDALGAIFSHLAVKDTVIATTAPIVFLAFAVGSYICRPPGYRVGPLSRLDEAAP
ncbi:MAG TPA: DoxX family protein [Terracidiphilus sp.]|nr:DoxX family protein [Terracidiphilus sp.]